MSRLICFAEGDKFYRTEDMDTVREKWLKKRPQLVEVGIISSPESKAQVRYYYDNGPSSIYTFKVV